MNGGIEEVSRNERTCGGVREFKERLWKGNDCG